MIENKQQGTFLIDTNFGEFGPAIIPRAAKSADSTQRPHSGFLRISNLESLLGQQVFWILPAARKLPARTYCQSRVILRGNMSVIISMLRGVNVGGRARRRRRAGGPLVWASRRPTARRRGERVPEQNPPPKHAKTARSPAG